MNSPCSLWDFALTANGTPIDSGARFQPQVASIEHRVEHRVDERTGHPLAHRGQKGRQPLGRLVESCIGAHLFNSSFGTNISVTYWRERNHEVDFVLQEGKTTIAIEVKSGGRHESFPGMEAFVQQFKPKRQLLVGGQGIILGEFLSKPAAHWLH